MPYGDINLRKHWPRWWLVAWSNADLWSVWGWFHKRYLSHQSLTWAWNYSETPHEQPPHEQPPLLWGHIFRHHYIFLTSHLNVNPWWTATPLTWSEASDFGSSHPWRAATQQLLEVASHGIHGWFGCGLTDIHVNHTSGQPWVHRPKACKGVDHT